jgi:histone H3/H4
MTPEELAQELKELARDVSEQAKKRGITYKDVNRIIDKSRKRWRTS